MVSKMSGFIDRQKELKFWGRGTVGSAVAKHHGVWSFRSRDWAYQLGVHLQQKDTNFVL